jgi:hypothetical protein
MNIINKINSSKLFYKQNNILPIFSQEYTTIHEKKNELIKNYFRRTPILLVNDETLTIDDQISFLYDFINNKYLSDSDLNTVISYNILLEWCFDKYLTHKTLYNDNIKIGNITDEIQRLFTDLYLILITKNVGESIVILCLFVITNIYKSFYCFNIVQDKKIFIEKMIKIEGISLGFYKDYLVKINIDKDKINLQYLHYYYFQKYDKLKKISILNTLKSRLNSESDNTFVSIYIQHISLPGIKSQVEKSNIIYDIDKDTKFINITMNKFIKLNIDYELYKNEVYVKLMNIQENNIEEINVIKTQFGLITQQFINNLTSTDSLLKQTIEDENKNSINSILSVIYKNNINGSFKIDDLHVENSSIFNISNEQIINILIEMRNNIINTVLNDNFVNRSRIAGIDLEITEVENNTEPNEEHTIQNNEINVETHNNIQINDNVNTQQNIELQNRLVNTAIENDREIVHDHRVVYDIVKIIKEISPPIHNKSIEEIINELDNLPIDKYKGVKICVGMLNNIKDQMDILFNSDFENGLSVIDAVKLVYDRTDNQTLINSVLSCLNNLYLVIDKNIEVELYGIVNKINDTTIEDEILDVIYSCEHIKVDFNICCATGQFIKILSCVEGTTIKLIDENSFYVPFISSNNILKNEILFMLSKMINDYESEEELYKNARPLAKKIYNYIDPKEIDEIFDSFITQ